MAGYARVSLPEKGIKTYVHNVAKRCRALMRIPYCIAYKTCYICLAYALFLL